MLRRRKLLILGCCASCLFLACLYILIKTPRYEATARIEVSPAGTNSLGLDQMASRVLSPSDPTIQLQSAVTVLQSNTIALAVMQQLKLARRRDFAGRWAQPASVPFADLPPGGRDGLLLRFRKNLSVEVVPKTDILAVQFRAKDPTLAAEVVNSTVAVMPNEIFAAATTRPRWCRTGYRSRWTTSEAQGQRVTGEIGQSSERTRAHWGR